MSLPPFTVRAHVPSPSTLARGQGAQHPWLLLQALPRVCVCVHTRVHVWSSIAAAQWESKV